MDTGGHVAWQIIKPRTRNKNNQPKGDTQIPQPDLRFASRGVYRGLANFGKLYRSPKIDMILGDGVGASLVKDFSFNVHSLPMIHWTFTDQSLQTAALAASLTPGCCFFPLRKCIFSVCSLAGRLTLYDKFTRESSTSTRPPSWLVLHSPSASAAFPGARCPGWCLWLPLLRGFGLFCLAWPVFGFVGFVWCFCVLVVSAGFSLLRTSVWTGTFVYSAFTCTTKALIDHCTCVSVRRLDRFTCTVDLPLLSFIAIV